MHKYRNPDPNAEKTDIIRVVTDTGHVARVGPDWQELPEIYHDAAIAAGCECDARTIKKANVKPQASGQAKGDGSTEALIEKALKALIERDADEDYTSTNDPKVEVVSELAGINVTRAQITPIWERLQAEAEKQD